MNKNNIAVIYGAGNYGRDLLKLLENLNVFVDYFIQTEVKDPINVEGISVISWDRLLHYQNIIVFYAIRNEKVLGYIKKSILEENRKDIKVYNCVDFIESNLHLKATISNQGKKECLICKNRFEDFSCGGIDEEVFNTHHIIGGGYRKNYACPICKSIDRERWLYYLLIKKVNINSAKGRILHFAPERHITNLIKNNIDIDYYTGDIVKGRAMHVTDITNIQYSDKSMDYIICNHVLEHIEDIESAISEIRRVLKDDGVFIFSFPICTDMKTLEDSSIISDADRLKYYGQKDHVRLYGMDYADIYARYGFVLEICSPKDMLQKEEIEKYGFIEDDVVIIAKKV